MLIRKDRELPFLRNAGEHRSSPIPQNWDTLYEITKREPAVQQQIHEEETIAVEEQEINKTGERQLFQIQGRFILSQIKSGFMLISQQAAHERVFV